MTNIHKIKKGDIYKNYKELCITLDESIKSGKSKKLQLSEWERYFRCRKDGHKFIIEEIFNDPVIKMETRGGANNTVEYISNIEKLILHMLAQQDNMGKVFLSKNKMFQLLRMVNEHYIVGKYKPLRLSKLSDIPKSHIVDFYQTSDNMLKRNLESALDNLKKKSLVFWSHSMTVGVAEAYVYKDHHDNILMNLEKIPDHYGDERIHISASPVVNTIRHRKATDAEIQKIMNAQKQVLKEMKLKDLQDVFIKNKSEAFYSKVIDYLFSPMNGDKEKIYTYYNSYEIIFNIDDVEDELEELGKSELSLDEKIQVEKILNLAVINRINDNGGKRHRNAIKNESKKKLRSDITYEDNINKLSQILVSNDQTLEITRITDKLK